MGVRAASLAVVLSRLGLLEARKVVVATAARQMVTPPPGRYL